MSDFAVRLRSLADDYVYPPLGEVAARWGQLLRQHPAISTAMAAWSRGGKVVPLQDLARVKSGVVTRANAFFIVKELPLDQIPVRFRITRRDLERIAVVLDGTETPFRLERAHLRSVVKGPEALISPTRVANDDKRLLDVRLSKDELREHHDNGVLAYLRRGETVPYKVSEDSLKGGIPAQRSNIRNRRPYWYSLGVPDISGPRIVVPEHFGSRYIASLLDEGNESVVIDTCYLATVRDPDTAPVLLAALNSLATWYQIELRGRTQHGEGVLKVKIPDWHGVLVLNPAQLTADQTSRLLEAWSRLEDVDPGNALDAVLEPSRIAFDTLYLELCGAADPADLRLLIERELRAAIAERHQRPESVAESRRERRSAKRIVASVDAYAARIASRMEPYPDPRKYMRSSTPTVEVSVVWPEGGQLEVGNDLFTFNSVLAGGEVIATAPSPLGAQYLRGVLLRDPELTQVSVPLAPHVEPIVERWQAECEEWLEKFNEVYRDATVSLFDDRVRRQIHERALQLLNAK